VVRNAGWVLQGGDYRPRLHPAGVEQHPLAAQARPPRLQDRVDARLLAGDHGIGALGQGGVVDDPGEGAQGNIRRR